MQFKKMRNNFIEYLKDERFIEWKLFQSEELQRYWKDYILQYPEELKKIELAEKHFDQIKLSPIKLSDEKKQEAVKRLQESLKTYHRKLIIRRFAYAAAVCILLLLLSKLYITKEINRSSDKILTSSDCIVGSELESKDIIFITGNRTMSFQNNVDIQIDEERTVQIKCEKEEKEVISIEQHTMNRLIIPYGRRSKIILSDGTQIWLNSGSSLEFPSTFSGNMREVLLSGEMYIEVAPVKNSLFFVRTSDYNVKVYGTKFNVSTYPGSTSSVVLVEGSIGLQSADKPELILSPKEQAIYSDNGIFQIKEVNVTQFISWKDGYLSFEDTPIIVALKQIERYYNLSFNYGDNLSFQGFTCTGKIILSDNLDNVLSALTLISSTHYKKEDKLIHIYKK